jgi:PKD repeat protein
MKRFILLTLVLCVLVGVASAWGADMGGWDYRKEITINNTGSNLTDYQLMFTVNRSAGSDSGFTTYLNGKCESDYDDIRFTTGENTLCDYWIESSSSTVATIWVEVPSIVNSTAYGSTTMYLYYGNAVASAVSDGDNTFPLFDDFPGSSLNATKWNVLGGVITVASGSVSWTTGSGTGINSVKAFGTNYSLVTRFKPHEVTGVHVSDPIGFQSGTGTYYAVFYNGYLTAGKQTAIVRNNGSVSEKLFTNPGVDVFHRYEIIRNGSTSVIAILDGATGTITTNFPTTDLPVKLGSDGTLGYDPYVDWVLVRKYTATEPTVSAWGSEEEQFPEYLTVDFSGVPTSGYVPLTVYFTDASVGYNVTLDTWSWSFGDTSPNSTQQDPAHTYTTSGLYNLILTVTNTSSSNTNTTQKTAYINVTVNPDAPNADFTVTETCGNMGDTFYFIDFSTGGGLYAWNWSFGDDTYSELRNPTHQYSSNGTYDVGLTVWGAYGFDSLLRSNLITVPCGAPTPTPTPTVTATITPGNVTSGNITFIYAPDQDYVPFPIWLAIVIVTIALFGHSIIFLKNSDLTAIMAALFAMISAWLSNMIGYIDVQVTSFAEEIVISPVVQAVHPPWLVYTMLIFAFVSVMNIFAAIYKVYLKPVPWNEIYDRKLPKWERRK